MTNIQQARALDQADSLASKKNLFRLNHDEIYLDGNSLGPLPIPAITRVNETLEQEWGVRQIRSWNDSWINLPQNVGAKIAPIIGARSENVICADSVSVNLFKLIAAAIQSNPTRKTIVSVQDMFPTDLYIAQGLRELLGFNNCLLKLCDIATLESTIDQETSVVILSQVNFRTGEAYDLASITQAIQRRGAKVIWDVSHSAGVLPIEVEVSNIDYAVGCGYKFLNGGPGAPAFVYVRPDLQDTLKQPLSGWMGHRDPFEFSRDYQPASGMERLLTGTPNILSLVSLDAALDIYSQLNLNAVYEKAQHLAQFFIESISKNEVFSELSIIAPDHRGAQVSVTHPKAYSMTQALIDSGVICDYRESNIARFGFAPLYTSFEDVAKAVLILEDIVLNRAYEQPEYQTVGKVT